MLLDDARWAAFNRKRDAVAREMERMKTTWVHAGALPSEDAQRLLGAPIEHDYSLAELLKRYKADEITPEEYHQQRAKILAEP